MSCPPNAGWVHSPAWKRLLLTGTLLTACICSASSERPSSGSLDFLAEGASAHLPVPSNLDGILSTSWFRGHEAQPEAVTSSPEGLPGPGHPGREMLGAGGSLVIRNMTASDSGGYSGMLKTKRGRRSVTKQMPVKTTRTPVWVTSFPMASRDIIRSELNYSVILQCISSRTKPYWTFNGKPCWAEELLIVRRLSREHLGSYACVVNGSQQQYFSKSVSIALPEVTEDPMDEPEPDSTLTLSGGSAVALLLAGSVGLVVLLAGIFYTITQARRTDRRRVQMCC